MNTGIRIDIRIASFTIARSPYLKIEYTRGAVIDTARFRIADTENDIYGRINNGDGVVIEFGYSGGAAGRFTGVVNGVRAAGKDTIEVIAASDSVRLAETYVKESYNDETSLEIIKRLVASAGFGVGKIDIPDVRIPHIIFDNIPVYTAVNRVYATLRNLGHDLTAKEYWTRDGLFYAGDFSMPGETPDIRTAYNIINHGFANRGYAALETPLIAALAHSQDFKLTDTRRDISGLFRAQSVIHEIDKGKARTHIGYKI